MEKRKITTHPDIVHRRRCASGVVWFVALMLLALAPAYAEHDRGGDRHNQMGIQAGQPNQLNPDQRGRIAVSNQRAATLVREKYTEDRILGVSLMNAQGPPVYRVKTLSASGVVRSVFVDGMSGEVFE